MSFGEQKMRNKKYEFEIKTVSRANMFEETDIIVIL